MQKYDEDFKSPDLDWSSLRLHDKKAFMPLIVRALLSGYFYDGFNRKFQGSKSEDPSKQLATPFIVVRGQPEPGKFTYLHTLVIEGMRRPTDPAKFLKRLGECATYIGMPIGKLRQLVGVDSGSGGRQSDDLSPDMLDGLEEFFGELDNVDDKAGGAGCSQSGEAGGEAGFSRAEVDALDGLVALDGNSPNHRRLEKVSAAAVAVLDGEGARLSRQLSQASSGSPVKGEKHDNASPVEGEEHGNASLAREDGSSQGDVKPFVKTEDDGFWPLACGGSTVSDNSSNGINPKVIDMLRASGYSEDEIKNVCEASRHPMNWDFLSGP